MKRLALSVVFILLIVLAVVPAAGQEAIRYVLNADIVIRIVTRMGYMTVLEFPSTVDEIYCGDTGAFGVEAVGRRVVVKAFLAGGQTNMIVSIGTNKRYIFELVESGVEPPNYLVTLIDPERGLNFAALIDTVNKALQADGVFTTEINRVSMIPELRTRVAVIRLMRDTRKNLSVVWLRLFNSLKKIDDQRIMIPGFTRIAVVSEVLAKDDVFTRNYRDFYLVVADTQLSDRFALSLPWDAQTVTFTPADSDGTYYVPNLTAVPSRHFRVWIDEFTDLTTGREIVVPGHYDNFEIQNYMERGETND